ncbi:hypothetical protein N7532_005237 [Penicillium argentinense]|uniref:Uncharacterized protein n=1 Tax=Penicillium argentinense TaxID=1131581 RepID=A0A9W9KA67_9EURO|nr:uncharacterized protein N7532_005237 [Penicillium argentinense]KAJ5098236.1 hypothetical protein N7532_005237 [Penicillium argentinense]
MSPKVVKAPVASFSPAIRSRVRNDEGSSSEGSQGKKRKSSATYASVRKRMFQPVSGGNLQMRKIPEDPEENSESELEPMPFIAPPPSRAPTPPFTPVASPGVQLNLRRRPSLIQQFGQKIMRLSSWMGSDKAVPKRLGEAQTAIYSLEISDQSKIYGTIDSMVCTTANKFLMKNYYAGRVSTESIAMVREHWKAQNRPQVLEFCFSQAIQQKLIFANRDTLQFAGAASTNPIVIDKIMTNWKMMAQDMGKRILCQPDSVVRKHINDTIDILKMLDATDDAIVNMQVMGVQVSKKLQDEFGKRLSQTTVGVLNSARRSHGQNSC